MAGIGNTARFGRRLSTCAVLILVFIVAGCSERDGNPSSSEDVVGDARSVFVIAHEQIQGCMRSKGFDYEIPTYIDQPLPEYGELLELADPQLLGYRVVMQQLANSTRSSPIASRSTQSEVEAFQTALFGAQHEHDEGHEHHEHHDACLNTVSTESVQIYSTAERERLLDFVSAATALPQYVEFSELWVSCMSFRGVAVRGASPREHELAFERAHLVEVREAINGADYARLEQFLDPSTINQPWVATVVGEFPELERLLEFEVALAVADHACRQEHRSVVEDAIGTLAEQTLDLD